MQVMEFIVTIRGLDHGRGDFDDVMFEAGSGDGTFFACGGLLQCHFHREAATFDEAVASARADVAKAGGEICAVEGC